MAQVNSAQAPARSAHLPRGETMVLENAQGTVIEVDRGCLWLTLQDDTRDVILVAGMRFEIDRSGRTVIVAEQDTCMRVRDQLGPLARLVARMRAMAGPAYTGWAERNLRRSLHYF